MLAVFMETKAVSFYFISYKNRTSCKSRETVLQIIESFTEEDL